MYGQEIQEGEEGDADLLGPAVAQDLHQADQAAVWSEQVPNALAHLWQRSMLLAMSWRSCFTADQQWSFLAFCWPPLRLPLSSQS